MNYRQYKANQYDQILWGLYCDNQKYYRKSFDAAKEEIKKDLGCCRASELPALIEHYANDKAPTVH